MDFCQQHIGPKIKSLSASMSQEMNRNNAALELTGSQAIFLGYIIHHRDRPVFPRDLEREFDFSHPTVSGVLRRLESKGFVTFQPGAADKRCKQILVTEKAIRSHNAIVQHMIETENKATAGMSAAEIAELNRLLGLVMRNMGITPCCKPRIEQEEHT